MRNKTKNKTYINFLLTALLLTSVMSPGAYANTPEQNIPAKDETSFNQVETQETKAQDPQAQDEVTQESKNIQSDEQEIPAEIQEAITEEIDKHIVKATSQMQKIDTVLEELAQVIQNGLIKTKNKTHLILQIKSLRQFIAQLVNNPFTEADITTVNFLLTVNKCLINHIKRAVKNGLKKIPDINPEDIMPKTRISSIEQLEEKFQNNEKAYTYLQKSVQNVGLSWVNWIYRNLVVAPAKVAKKYHVPTITKWSIVGGAVMGYILYRFTNKLKRYVGESPQMDNYGKLENEDELGKLGKFDYALYSTERMPVAKILLFAAPFLLKNEFKKARLWVQEKLELLHCKLMGGVHSKKAEQKYDFTTPRYTFKDVVGLEHVKKELKPLVEYIKNCARFERVGIGPEKGYLFAGKPGTGKSFMAEALAGEIAQSLREGDASDGAFRFIPFEASEIYEIITEKGISDGIEAIMLFAQENAPCVVFIDEPDLLGLQRTANRELLSKLLNAMNGFLSNNITENVILLAATNRPDNLDPALLRRGRLGKIIHFEYPTFEARKEYLQRRLNPIVADLKDFDLEKIARETKGATFEALQSMVRKAFQTTKIRGTSLTQQTLINAMNEEIRQILPETKNLSEKELQIIAAQQASMALANVLLDPCDKLACVTIKPVMKTIRESNVWDRYYEKQDSIIQQGKLFTYKAGDSSGVYPKQDLLNNCKIALAGDIGQDILLGSCGHGYNKSDKDKALAIALSIASEGLDLKDMPKKLKQEYYQKALEIMSTCKKEMRTLLESNKDKLENIFDALLARKILDAQDVKEIIESQKTEV
ncbi:AAA family ATPase [Candidatus Dependentiae bacterium]